MKELVENRLDSFGYKMKDGDEALLVFSIQKVQNTIKNDCNVSSVPEGLLNIAVDMAVGEFLMAKKTFSPEDMESLDLDAAVKQIQEGDTNIVFATGEASLTPEQRLNNFLNYLLTNGRDEFSCYRRDKMVKALIKARKAARKAIEAAYDGECTVIEYKDIADSDTGLAGKAEVVVLEKQPCKLSFEKIAAAPLAEMTAKVSQGIKLFLAPEVQVAEGSKIIVEQKGRVFEYQASGTPAVYETHQEIMLELWKEWA